MKLPSAAVAALAAVAIGAATLAPGASAWEECPPGNDNPEYCEHHHHHHHHHRSGWDPSSDYGRWSSSLATAVH
jgi:hypothetical protein